MSLNRILAQINEHFNIEEDNTTTSGGEYETPFAFGKKVKKPKDSAYSEEMNSTDRFFKKIEETINEISYNDYRDDHSKSERQKINDSILEINKRLREVEQMINHASKLKNEAGHSNEIFWKRTGNSFLKIKERLNRLTTKVVEITG